MIYQPLIRLTVCRGTVGVRSERLKNDEVGRKTKKPRRAVEVEAKRDCDIFLNYPKFASKTSNTDCYLRVTSKRTDSNRNVFRSALVLLCDCPWQDLISSCNKFRSIVLSKAECNNLWQNRCIFYSHNVNGDTGGSVVSKYSDEQCLVIDTWWLRFNVGV
jgi:hypothetical protein